MPLITFESGQLSDEVKRKLIIELTDLSSKISGIPKELFFVTIKELPDENIAIGGITVAEIKSNFNK